MLRAHRPSHLSSIAAGQVIALIGRGHRACHARASPGVIPIKHRRLSGDCLDWPRRGRALVQIFLAASLDYCSLFAPVHIWNKIFVVSTLVGWMDVWIHGSSSLKPGRRSNPDDLKEMQPLSGFHSTRARQVPLHNIPMRRDFSRWRILWSWQFFGACQIQPQRGEKHGHDMQEACPHQIPLLGEVLRLGLGLGLRLGALRPPPRRRLRLARAAGVRSCRALLRLLQEPCRTGDRTVAAANGRSG